MSIVFDQVNFSYQKSQPILESLSFEVKTGQVLGLLGPNGAGKSTTIRLLLGLMKPDFGRILVAEQSPELVTTRQKIGYLPEVAQYYPYMTFAEALRFYGRLSGMASGFIKERSELLAEQLQATNLLNRRLNAMSKGQLQRLGLAQALLHDPEVLVLDEPMSGLDPLARIQIKEMIVQQQSLGKTILFSSHELSEIETVCDAYVILKHGRSVWSGDAQALLATSSGHLEKHFLSLIG